MISYYDIEPKIEKVQAKIESVKYDFRDIQVSRQHLECPRWGHLWEGVEGTIAQAEQNLQKAIDLLADAVSTCQSIALSDAKYDQNEEE